MRDRMSRIRYPQLNYPPIMKKAILLSLGLFLVASSPGWGQSDNSLVVMECQGKIKYYPSEGKPMKVVSGLVIDPEGTVKLGKESSLQVLNGTSLVPISQTGKMTVQDALPSGSSSMRLGFSTDFLTMVQKTMRSSSGPPSALTGRKGAGGEEPPPSTTTKKGAGGEEPPPPTTIKKGAGGEEPPPPTTTKKGAGGEEPPPPTTTKKGMGYGLTMVNWNFPLKGKLYAASDPIFFSWEGYVEGEGPWLFTITNSKDRSEVYRIETPDQYISLTAIQAKLTTGNTYTWRVARASIPASTLKAYEFSMVQENMEKGVTEAVQMEEDYQKAGDVQKLLWEAYAFEQAGFLIKADTLHKKALYMEPDNWLAVQLYRAFWGRNY